MPSLAVSSRDLAQRLVARVDGLLDQHDTLRLAARAGIVLDDWQAGILASTAQILLINCSRQAGKSTIVALVIAREIIKPNRLVIIVSPSERQSKELMRKVLAFWRRIGRPVPHVTAGKTTLELINGSRIEALPGNQDTIRGFSSVNLLIADEASLVDDDLHGAVTPMLAVSNGRLLAPSTPHGKRGWWYDLWQLKDDPDIERVEVPATLVPHRIPPLLLARELRQKGADYVDQEYLCKFLDDERQAFSTEDIEASQVDGLETWAWALEEGEVA